jgi:uncharacterized protein YndB with AHSA1/START domain
MTRITLVRRIAARQSIVFEALTTADGVARWWGTDDLPVIEAEVDARVGGVFRICFPTLDGQEHEACGEYLELVAPTRLVMSWRWMRGGVAEELDGVSRIEMELRPVDDGVELTVTHADLRNDVSGTIHEHGWMASLARLGRLLGVSFERTDLNLEDR